MATKVYKLRNRLTGELHTTQDEYQLYYYRREVRHVTEFTDSDLALEFPYGIPEELELVEVMTLEGK